MACRLAARSPGDGHDRGLGALAGTLLRDRAARHYRASAGLVRGSTPAVLRPRAEHQVETAPGFIPRYYGLAACELLLLAGLAWAGRRGILPVAAGLLCPLLCLTLAEMAGFGLGLNPAIEPGIQQFEPPVIALLRAGLKPGQRALGIGQELPPNVLMRFGLDDPRNYDSVELASQSEMAGASLRARPRGPYQPPRDHLGGRASRAGAARASHASRPSSGQRPPPRTSSRSVERAGDVWIAWLAPAAGRAPGRQPRSP